MGDRVPPKSKEQTVRETITGLIIAGIGAYLIFRPPELFGVSALYFGAGMLGSGMYFTNKKRTEEWMAALRDLGAFWRRTD